MEPDFLTTSFGWIDFSKEQKNRVGAVLDLLKFEGMVDELGIGTVRDILADRMFPGISTIQTRAKYFFYIPYILWEYQLLPSAKKKKNIPMNFLEQQEYELMWDLGKMYKDIPQNGVIGISKKRNEKIVRRPSVIYWNGLYTFGLIDTGGLGSNSFLKSVNNQSASDLLSSQTQGDDVSKDDADVDYENIFRVKVPYKKNWKDFLSMELDKDEASILKDHINSNADGTLLALLLEDDNIWKIFSAAKSFSEFAKACDGKRLPASILKDIQLAHDFSELMFGSHLYYNVLIQKKKFDNNHNAQEWEDWKEVILDNLMLGALFDPDEVFSLGKVNRDKTIQFINMFWEMVKQGFLDDSALKKMIINQEFGVKGAKARLFTDKLHDVQEKKWVGLKHFEYRFNQVKVIVNDIRNPK